MTRSAARRGRGVAVAGLLLVAVVAGGCFSTDDQVVTFPPVSFGTATR